MLCCLHLYLRILFCHGLQLECQASLSWPIVTEDMTDDADSVNKKCLFVRGNMLLRTFHMCTVEVKLIEAFLSVLCLFVVEFENGNYESTCKLP